MSYDFDMYSYKSMPSMNQRNVASIILSSVMNAEVKVHRRGRALRPAAIT